MGHFFTLVATLLLTLLLTGGNYTVHQSIRPYGPGPLDLPDMIHSDPLHPLLMCTSAFRNVVFLHFWQYIHYKGMD